jgi:hypothetical protein
MGTTAAPRIDDRLRRLIAGSSSGETAAEVTRLVGALAEDLRLARPSYQQVRVHLNEARADRPPARVKTRRALELVDLMYDYPFPGAGDFCRRMGL